MRALICLLLLGGCAPVLSMTAGLFPVLQFDTKPAATGDWCLDHADIAWARPDCQTHDQASN